MADEFHNTPYLGTYYYVINLTQGAARQEASIRKALSLAINREILTDKITQAGELPAYSWVPPDIAGYQQQSTDFKDMSQDERNWPRRRSSMAEAGYGPDNPLQLELLYNTSDNHKKIAVAVASMWKKIGVETTLTNQEWKVYLDTPRQEELRDRASGLDRRLCRSAQFPRACSCRTPASGTTPATTIRSSTSCCAQAAATVDPSARLKLLPAGREDLPRRHRDDPDLPLHLAST